ncbi:predicted protein [Histoplasma capsulatum var. duboisii H88]|uniref:Predicted protein n=2 Tax=Ajellomyces capsulatus TaxID=5037 RepID=F0U6K8_AJEC8|nr:predicted protein [Histoplasma capsulatum H143]EGC40647.1 predicted protein [Histoplasma capsulatum var. duboisii H88]
MGQVRGNDSATSRKVDFVFPEWLTSIRIRATLPKTQATAPLHAELAGPCCTGAQGEGKGPLPKSEHVGSTQRRQQSSIEGPFVPGLDSLFLVTAASQSALRAMFHARQLTNMQHTTAPRERQTCESPVQLADMPEADLSAKHQVGKPSAILYLGPAQRTFPDPAVKLVDVNKSQEIEGPPSQTTVNEVALDVSEDIADIKERFSSRGR